MTTPAKPQKSTLLVTLSAAALAGPLAGSRAALAQTITCGVPLIFGTMASCGAASTVTVTPSNTRSTTGCVTTIGGAYSKGTCFVNGTFPVQPIQITVAAATYNINSGGDSMAINNINLVTNAGGRTHTTTTLFATIDIGARLNVGTNQAQGTYTGSFTVTAIYQ